MNEGKLIGLMFRISKNFVVPFKKSNGRSLDGYIRINISNILNLFFSAASHKISEAMEVSKISLHLGFELCRLALGSANGFHNCDFSIVWCWPYDSENYLLSLT